MPFATFVFRCPPVIGNWTTSIPLFELWPFSIASHGNDTMSVEHVAFCGTPINNLHRIASPWGVDAIYVTRLPRRAVVFLIFFHAACSFFGLKRNRPIAVVFERRQSERIHFINLTVFQYCIQTQPASFPKRIPRHPPPRLRPIVAIAVIAHTRRGCRRGRRLFLMRFNGLRLEKTGASFGCRKKIPDAVF